MAKLIIGKRYRLMSKKEFEAHPEHEGSEITGCYINERMKRKYLGTIVTVSEHYGGKSDWYKIKEDDTTWDYPSILFLPFFTPEDIYNEFK